MASGAAPSARINSARARPSAGICSVTSIAESPREAGAAFFRLARVGFFAFFAAEVEGLAAMVSFPCYGELLKSQSGSADRSTKLQVAADRVNLFQHLAHLSCHGGSLSRIRQLPILNP